MTEKEEKKKSKPKISFQLLANIHGYTAVWMIDGKKHTQSILADDKSKANQIFKQIQEKIKRKYADS